MVLNVSLYQHRLKDSLTVRHLVSYPQSFWFSESGMWPSNLHFQVAGYSDNAILRIHVLQTTALALSWTYYFWKLWEQGCGGEMQVKKKKNANDWFFLYPSIILLKWKRTNTDFSYALGSLHTLSHLIVTVFLSEHNLVPYIIYK